MHTQTYLSVHVATHPTRNMLSHTQINHLACEHTNDVVDFNEDGDMLVKAANDATHGDITLMPP